MHAMADLGDGRACRRPTSRPRSGTTSRAGSRRSATGLLTKGLIYAPERGLLAFTVPHMDGYLRRLAERP